MFPSAVVRTLIAMLICLPLAIMAHGKSLGDSNGCNGIAIKNSMGIWQLICQGESCGPGNDQPCGDLQGGVPGASFTFCGCDDSEPKTPICCYTVLDDQTGLPRTNGFCFGQVIPAGICHLPPCKLIPIGGNEGIKEGKCTGGPPEEPPPDPED